MEYLREFSLNKCEHFRTESSWKNTLLKKVKENTSINFQDIAR